MAGPVNVRLYRPKQYYGMHSAAKAGFAPIVKAFEDFCRTLEQEILPDVMLDALEPTLGLSLSYTPYATGELYNSAFLDVSKRGRNPQVEIGYGKDGQAPYALQVHEIPAYHEPPTRYKYLEAALMEDSGDILQRIADGVKGGSGL